MTDDCRARVRDILTIGDGRITQVDTFDPHGCRGFDLPEVLA